MKHIIATILLLSASPALAEVPNPPPLNGHPVVDAANIIPPDREEALNQRLLNIEKRSGHQLAVLTVPDMGGYEIEEYSLNAARFYGLGGKNRHEEISHTRHEGGILRSSESFAALFDHNLFRR